LTNIPSHLAKLVDADIKHNCAEYVPASMGYDAYCTFISRQPHGYFEPCAQTSNIRSSLGCKYYIDSVLPYNKQLEMQLHCNENDITITCAVCNEPFVKTSNRSKYCSPQCALTARQEQDRERKRKNKGN
jgi:hypothetical protein